MGQKSVHIHIGDVLDQEINAIKNEFTQTNSSFGSSN
jgi:hypothetical protein